MKKTKYLKQYQGVTSGSFMGRDDGYPETKNIVYEDFDKMLESFGKQSGEIFYKLVPIEKEEIEKEIDSRKKSKEAEKLKKEEERKKEILERISACENKLEDQELDEFLRELLEKELKQLNRSL